MTWLLPAKSLNRDHTGTEHGHDLMETHAPYDAATNKPEEDTARLQYDERGKTVVMSANHYEKILLLRSLCEKLVKQLRIDNEIREYEAALYKRITSPESLRAADALFRATAEDLRRAYKHGKTGTR